MSVTVEFEINKQFKNYIVIIKNMSEDREKSFYDTYGKDAFVFGYVMKQKIFYKNFRIAKVSKKKNNYNKKKTKIEKVFTSYSGVPSYKLQEMISVLNYYHINYIIIDKMQNYKVIQIKQFKDNKYEKYYQKGLYYKKILYKMKSINEFLRANSDNGDIMYLIYDIERCINDYYKKSTKIKENWKSENEI